MSKGTIFAKKYWFLVKKMLIIRKIKGVLVLKDTLSKTKCVRLLKYQISSFYRNSSEFQTGVNFAPSPPPPPPQNKPLKNPPRLGLSNLSAAPRKRLVEQMFISQVWNRSLANHNLIKKITLGICLQATATVMSLF